MKQFSILEIRDLKKSFFQQKIGADELEELFILNGVNLSINKGESVAIIGRSGSGKSTLLSLMSSLDKETSGEILLDNNNLVTMNEEEKASIRSEYIGFVFQSPQLIDNLSALENVMMPLELKNEKNKRNKAREWLAKVGLKNRENNLPYQLSGGEAQRVSIARAFAASAKILFADEPTGSLDEKTGESIIDLLFSMNDEFGTTLVLVTHDMKLAKKCSRVMKLENGIIEEITVD